MRELRFHQDYVTCGSSPILFERAHRLTRMAFAVGSVVEVPFELHGRAFDALERIESADHPKYSTADVETLVSFLTAIASSLDAALDDQNRPITPFGDVVLEEARRPLVLDDGASDGDRVFQVAEDGSVGTVYPRMALSSFRDEMPHLISYLRHAARDGVEVAMLG